MFSEVISGALPQIEQKAVVPLAITSAKRLAWLPRSPRWRRKAGIRLRGAGLVWSRGPQGDARRRGRASRGRHQQGAGLGVLQARFEPLAIVIPGPQGPGSAETYMAKDRALWEPLVRSLNISLD